MRYLENFVLNIRAQFPIQERYGISREVYIAALVFINKMLIAADAAIIDPKCSIAGPIPLVLAKTAIDEYAKIREPSDIDFMLKLPKGSTKRYLSDRAQLARVNKVSIQQQILAGTKLPSDVNPAINREIKSDFIRERYELAAEYKSRLILLNADGILFTSLF